MTEKQAKLQFLKKLIDFIALQTGKPIDVSPIKIIAGLEPGRTRYLLQLFTVVATSKVETLTIGDGGDGIKLNVQSYVVNDGISNSSSFEVPTMRPATFNSNGTRLHVSTSGNSLSSTAYGSGMTEPEGRFQDAMPMPSSLRCISAEMGHNFFDANNALSVADTRPATAYGIKPMNGTGADTFPSEMSLNRHATRSCLPLKLSGIDFMTLAGAVRHIAESTSSLGKYIDAVHDDLVTLVSERNHCIDEQHF